MLARQLHALHGIRCAQHALQRVPRAAAAAAALHTTQATAATPRSHPVVYHTDFQISPIPDDHRFPMPKDHLLYLALQAEGLAQLTFTPTYPDAATLCLVHDQQYVTSFLGGSISQQEMRKIGLPWSEKLVQRTLIGTGSAILAARLALQYGVACMTNGGTHHAHTAHGSGWCIFNDLAVAGRAAQRDAGVKQVLMLDLDVHQGDGSATIFAGDPSVYTFSMHCGDQAFPAVLQQSDWDIALPAGTDDKQYLTVLQETLPVLLQQVQPDLVLYNAGVDVHRGDALGKLALTNDGIAQRDRAVFAACVQFEVPVACAIGGGYEKDHQHIVQRHLCLHRAAAESMDGFAEMMDRRRANRVQGSSSSRRQRRSSSAEQWSSSSELRMQLLPQQQEAI